MRTLPLPLASLRRASSVGAFLGLAALVAAGCSQDPTRPNAPGSAPPAAYASLPGSDGPDILIQLREDATEGQKRALAVVLERHAMSLGSSLVAGQVGVYGVGSRGGRSVADIASAIEATGAVEFAEVDALVYPAALAREVTPDDTYFGLQWHHTQVRTPAAWEITTGSAGVLVAICDGGIELTHPDLEANLVKPGYDLVNGMDDNTYVTSHGTKVAGMLGAVGNNEIGVTGVSWSVSMLSIRVTSDETGAASLSKLVECVDYARGRGAKVVNVSYNGVATSSAANTAGEALMAAGGLLFVSAGNNNQKLSGKNFPGMIVVGGTDENDQKASFSNWGSHIDLVAPAVRIRTTQLTTNTVQGPYIIGEKGESGTSFSAPIAAGVAALIWAANPTHSPATVQNILFSTAKDLGSAGYDQTFGHGRVDAGAALAAAVGTTPPPSDGDGGGGGGGKGGGPKK